MILYNCHHSGDQYRITKFNDGNIESSYLTTHHECDCPAGFRPTCRHRQMLPQMLADGIINTHWFLEWDNKGGVVDIFGTPKTTIDKLLEPLPIFDGAISVKYDENGRAHHGIPAMRKSAVPAGQHTAAEPTSEQIEPTLSPSPKPWRRF